MSARGIALVNQRKRMAKRIYEKITTVLSDTELEHMDVCYKYISEMILNDEAKRHILKQINSMDKKLRCKGNQRFTSLMEELEKLENEKVA